MAHFRYTVLPYPTPSEKLTIDYECCVTW